MLAPNDNDVVDQKDIEQQLKNTLNKATTLDLFIKKPFSMRTARSRKHLAADNDRVEGNETKAEPKGKHKIYMTRTLKQLRQTQHTTENVLCWQ